MFRRRISISSGGVKLDSPPFDIHFQMQFDTDPEPNTAIIDIFNLSQDTINRFRRSQSVVLNAGYEGDTGTILTGTIDESRAFWEVARGSGNERILRLEANDAMGRWLNTTISKTYKPGIKASQVIADMLNTFGLEIGSFRVPNDLTYQNGKTFSGSLRTALRQVVADTGASLSINNGAVFILPPGVGNRIAFVLNSDTGLVESPERIETEEGEFWRVKSLLNYRFKPNTIIKVESINVKGFFRIVKGEHICGDQDYETRMEVTPA